MTIEFGKLELDVSELMQLLPHRHPILLIDRLENIVDGKGAVGVKHLSSDDSVFKGHFPDNPIMPGVLIIETMAQTAAAYTAYTEGIDLKRELGLLVSLDKIRFRRVVTPGKDALRVNIHMIHRRKNAWKFTAIVYIKDEKVADGKFSMVITKHSVLC